MPRATLVLEDGSRFEGTSFGAPVSVSGETVFQTGMVGYPESLTDPSYSKQILVLTFPMIGNYGVPSEETKDNFGLPAFFESDKVHIAGLIVADYQQYSHWNATQSLGDWLAKHKVPAITGIDTRALTVHLREKGTMLGKIVMEADKEEDVTMVDPNRINLVANVSSKEVRHFNKESGSVQIIAVDVGLKYNQVRCLASRGARVKLVPWDYDFSKEKCDGLFLSNGPGDPTMCTETIVNLRKFMEHQPETPIFGICLGHQLLALAIGAPTYKLAYGNRGHNQPCTHDRTQRCFITSQNHGFACSADALPEGWEPLFTNENDKSNEGIVHKSRPWFSVQFHPEARAGPEDLEYLFDVFLDATRKNAPPKPMNDRITEAIVASMGSAKIEAEGKADIAPFKKILVLGSGGLTIGQAGEFDYSGSQAIKALKEEGIHTILINPNIATVQTMKGLADKVYFLPVTLEYVEQVIAHERPDGVALSFGGQTALNCGIQLDKAGVFEKYNVRVIGTPVKAIIETEDREAFTRKLHTINEHTCPNIACTTVEQVLAAAEKVGYPIMMRSSFALGGLGSGVVSNKEDLRKMAHHALANTTQVMIERSLRGWKEIEYEVVRDAYDNTITVCNMENFDPLGIHTGESIVVAPSQTLTNDEYNLLRNVACKVVRAIGIVGECNIQYALNPESMEYFIIEVNARLSRSSALASKATGYPLAYVAAKLALGRSLRELRNSVTRKTTACFEPSLDYCVVKVPRWDLSKFPEVDRKLGTSMKSVGEVMAIGRTFEEAFQKALRMVDTGVHGFDAGVCPVSDHELEFPSDQRPLVVASALAEGYTVERLYELTRIDPWFLHRLKKIIDTALALQKMTPTTITCEALVEAKKLGFCDAQIGKCISSNELGVRKLRNRMGIRPFVKLIDTVAAEYPAFTNYLYLTYHATQNDVTFEDDYTMVLGSGVYRIGSSVEFDYCAVGCVRELRRLGHRTIMVNYNPETVSTDYDECDRLYFDQLTFETVMDIYELEKVRGVILSMGGQIPNNIANMLHRQHVRVFGTSPEMIDSAENRYKFSRMCDTIGVDQPQWKELVSTTDAIKFANEVGFPVLIRPSYILSGTAMRVIHSDADLERDLAEAIVVSRDYPVVISKYILEAKEIEVDAVARNGEVVIAAISEHVENAGVHSGDATIVHPAQDLTDKTRAGVEAIARSVARALQINGPFNIQFIAKDDKLKVIECNVRVSRSFPFVSKTMDIDMIAIATQIMVGEDPVLPDQPVVVPHIGVKVPQFSFSRLAGADPTLGVDMISTGEVACFGKTREEAYLKAMLSTSFTMPKKNIFLSIGSFAGKQEFLASARALQSLGYNLFGSMGTADFYQSQGIAIEAVDWAREVEDNVGISEQFFSDGRFDLVFNLPMRNKYRRPASYVTSGAMIRQGAVAHKVPLITDIKCAKLFVEALKGLPRVDGACPLPLGPPVSPVDCQNSATIVRLPGLIDSHMYLADPTSLPSNIADTWEAGTSAALAGGFTLVCAVPVRDVGAFHSAPLDHSVISEACAARSCCDFALLLPATWPGSAARHTGTTTPPPNNLASAPSSPRRTISTSSARGGFDDARVGLPAAPEPAVQVPWENIVALEMDLDEIKHHSPELDSVRRYIQQCPADKPICVRASGHMLSSILFLGNIYQRAIHVCDVHRLEDITLIRDAKKHGMHVTCSTCPLHLFGINREAHDAMECGSDADRRTLWDNLDVIDVFSSEHGRRASHGFASCCEEALPVLLSAVQQARLTMEDIVLRMYTNPRKIFGLPEQPETFVEVVLGERSTLSAKPEWSKGHIVPFANRKVTGRVTRVVLRGTLAFLDGIKHVKAGFGREVTPHSVPKADAVKIIAEGAANVLPTIKKRSEMTSPSVDDSVAGDSDVAAGQHPRPESPVAALLRREISRPDSLAGKHILSVKQFTRPILHQLYNLAHEMKTRGAHKRLEGKILASIFYEPSTRTSSSFSSAMMRLGGSVIPLHQVMEQSSVKKGESLGDFIRTMECYSDVTVLRHPVKGAVAQAAAFATKPLINAGDGTGEHPTQALLDVYTIREELGTVNGLHIVFVGDLKNGRTVHSLARLLCLYRVVLHYVSPPSLKLPRDLYDELAGLGVEQHEHTDLMEVIPIADVLYVTRTQKERFDSLEEYERVRNAYCITPQTLVTAKKHMAVLHPLPRTDELSPEVDTDQRAAYIRQMAHGVHVRQALLAMVLGEV